MCLKTPHFESVKMTRKLFFSYTKRIDEQVLKFTDWLLLQIGQNVLSWLKRLARLTDETITFGFYIERAGFQPCIVALNQQRLEHFPIVFRGFQTDEDVIDEDFLFGWSNTKDRSVSVGQLTGVAARKIVRQLTLHLIIHNLPARLQLALRLLDGYLHPPLADGQLDLLRLYSS